VKEARIASKVFRLGMSREIEWLLKRLPVSSMREVTEGSHVYMAEGLVRIGARKEAVKVRLWVGAGTVRFKIRSKDGVLDVEIPIRNREDFEGVPDKVREAVRRCIS
jgi:hypothetical protein